jgi:hypothetical protein
MNKEQKELLALIYWDLGCVEPRNIVDSDERIHLELAITNLKDLMEQLKIKEHGENEE